MQAVCTSYVKSVQCRVQNEQAVHLLLVKNLVRGIVISLRIPIF